MLRNSEQRTNIANKGNGISIMLLEQTRRYEKPLYKESRASGSEMALEVNCNVKENGIILFSINLSMYSTVEKALGCCRQMVPSVLCVC